MRSVKEAAGRAQTSIVQTVWKPWTPPSTYDDPNVSYLGIAGCDVSSMLPWVGCNPLRLMLRG